MKIGERVELWVPIIGNLCNLCNINFKDFFDYQNLLYNFSMAKKDSEIAGSVRLDKNAFSLLREIAELEERTNSAIAYRALRLYIATFYADKYPNITPPSFDPAPPQAPNPKSPKDD